jgi:hypothetical protein
MMASDAKSEKVPFAWAITWPDGEVSFSRREPDENASALDLAITPLYAEHGRHIPQTSPAPGCDSGSHLAAIIRRAHAIGERKENQVGIENYPREWQCMIVAALEAFGAAQAPRVTVDVNSVRDGAFGECAKLITELTLKHGRATGTDYEQGVQDHGYRLLHQVRALAVSSTQEKPLSFCSRCGGKDPDCYICGTVVASTEGK